MPYDPQTSFAPICEVATGGLALVVHPLLGGHDKQGLVAEGGPPERLAELIAKDRPRWARVVKEADITAD